MGWAIAALLIVLVVGIAASLAFFNGPYVMGAAPYYYYPHPFFWFFPFGFILFFLFIFFVFRLAFWPRRWGYYGRWQSWDDAGEILRQRYARGEITKDQFEQMKRDIEHHD